MLLFKFMKIAFNKELNFCSKQHISNILLCSSQVFYSFM